MPQSWRPGRHDPAGAGRPGDPGHRDQAMAQGGRPDPIDPVLIRAPPARVALTRPVPPSRVTAMNGARWRSPPISSAKAAVPSQGRARAIRPGCPGPISMTYVARARLPSANASRSAPPASARATCRPARGRESGHDRTGWSRRWRPIAGWRRPDRSRTTGVRSAPAATTTWTTLGAHDRVDASTGAASARLSRTPERGSRRRLDAATWPPTRSARARHGRRARSARRPGRHRPGGPAARTAWRRPDSRTGTTRRRRNPACCDGSAQPRDRPRWHRGPGPRPFGGKTGPRSPTARRRDRRVVVVSHSGTSGPGHPVAEAQRSDPIEAGPGGGRSSS